MHQLHFLGSIVCRKCLTPDRRLNVTLAPDELNDKVSAFEDVAHKTFPDSHPMNRSGVHRARRLCSGPNKCSRAESFCVWTRYSDAPVIRFNDCRSCTGQSGRLNKRSSVLRMMTITKVAYDQGNYWHCI